MSCTHFGVLAQDGNLLVAELALELAADKTEQRVRLLGRIDRIHPEYVFVVLIIVLDLLLDGRRGRADTKEDRLGAGNVRQLAQRHAAVVAANQHVDVVIAGELVDSGNSDLGALVRRLALIGCDHFELSPEHPALLIELVYRHLDAVHPVASNLELDRCVDADADRLGLLCHRVFGCADDKRQHESHHRGDQ